MSTLLRRDPRTMFPDLVEWFEEPFRLHRFEVLTSAIWTVQHAYAATHSRTDVFHDHEDFCTI